MKSIWNNTFYNTQPALSWTFDISFDEYYEGDNNEMAAGLGRLAQAAVDITIGKRESEYTSVYYAGVEFKKLTRAQNTGTFTIKFNEDKFYTITGILENIYNNDNLNQEYFEAGTHVYNKPTIGNRKITVKMFDPNTIHRDPNPVVGYEFFNCRIMSIDDVPFSYESVDSITRSVTFVYDYMQYIDYRSNRIKKEQYEAKMKEAKEKVRKKVREESVLGMIDAKEQEWKNAVIEADEDLRKQMGYEQQQKESNGYRGPGRGASR